MTPLRIVAALASLPAGVLSIRLVAGYASQAGRDDLAFLPLLAMAPIVTGLLIVCASSGHRMEMRRRLDAAFMGGLIVGSASFFVGALGPLLLLRGGQGTSLGFFLTGPLGFDVGAITALAGTLRTRDTENDDPLTALGGPSSPLIRSVLAMLVGAIVAGVLGNAATFFSVAAWSGSDAATPATEAGRVWVWLPVAAWRIAAGAAGGYLAARVAGRQEVRHGAVLAVLQFIPVVLLVATTNLASVGAVLLATCLPVLAAAGIWAGARLRAAQVAER